jgi:hypothetical protein
MRWKVLTTAAVVSDAEVGQSLDEDALGDVDVCCVQQSNRFSRKMQKRRRSSWSAYIHNPSRRLGASHEKRRRRQKQTRRREIDRADGAVVVGVVRVTMRTRIS